ncbi:M64 family metallopeptidase [Spongiivirga citrea]|uniref:Peptidase M64 n=1 Tax=Spongiivirga citrea TaxID=1481457 RepID=A0A6M0CDT4_9FLAO|nr:M64 family metallopeptidase [Spongiivirga citrea]NER15975.1 hypothetical protein [Spongiivirga citrea]
MKYVILVLTILLVSCSGYEDSRIDPSFQPEIEESDLHKDGEVETLFANNSKGVNIVIMGDGFVRNDLQINGAYEQEVKEQIDFLFTIPPFKGREQFFNVHIVYTESQETGVDGFNDTTYDTALDLRLSENNFFNAPRAIVFVNDEEVVYKYAERAVPARENIHLIMIVSKGSFINGAANGIMAIASENNLETMVHEVGHALGGLADEYFFEENRDENYDASFVNNLDNTNDLTAIKWNYIAAHPNYSDFVGAYEGGGYVPNNVWRPEQESLMKGGWRFFNTPSREQIVKRIHEINELPYSFEDDFINNDEFVRSSKQGTSKLYLPLQGCVSTKK